MFQAHLQEDIMIRTFLAAIAILLFFFFSLIVFCIGWVIGRISPHSRDIMYLRILQGFCRILVFLSGARVTYIGREKIPQDEACVYIMNHRGLFDIPLSIALFPGLTGYIGKKEFAKVPLLSWWLKATKGYFIDRDNVREALKTILAGIDALKEGTSIAVFPEGTRGKGEETELLEFHEGTFKLATKSGAKIVPVAINGSRDLFDSHMPRLKAQRITVEVLDPVDPASLTGDEKKFPGRYVRSLIEETVRKNHIA